MENLVVKKLNEVMFNIVEENVVSHKTDLECDFKALLDKNEVSDSYYWLVRESGTDMLRIPDVYIDGLYCNEMAKYHAGYSKIFRIDVSKRGKKYIQGTITEIKRADFINLLNKNKKLKEDIKEVQLTVFSDSKGKSRLSLPFSDNIYYDILSELKITNEDYKTRYEKYIF